MASPQLRRLLPARPLGFERPFIEIPEQFARNLPIAGDSAAANGLASLLKHALAVTFRSLAKFFAVVLVLLIVSPITAPFAAYDLAVDVSPVQETFGSGTKVSTAVPLLTPFLLPSETAVHDPLFDDILLSVEALSSPFLTALRL